MLLRISPAIYASMWPTLVENDVAICEYFLLGMGRDKVTRNEVVAFLPPSVEGARSKTKADYHVKRVIGLPGDKVEIVAGIGVFVNDRMVNEQNYVANKAEYSLKCLGDIGGMMAPGESVRPYFGAERATDPIVVPAKHYFVLGDNRNISTDSHVYGFIRQETVRARVKCVRYRELKATAISWRCSFCQKGQSKVKLLIQGLGGYICNECLEAVHSSSAQIPEQTARCTLCMKWNDALSIHFSKRIAAGRACTACVKAAMQAYHEQMQDGNDEGQALEFAENLEYALEFLKAEDNERALHYAEAAQKQNPNDGMLLAVKVGALIGLHRADEAVELAQQAVSANEEKKSPKLYLLQALIAAERIDEAYDLCTAMLEQNPANMNVVALRSFILIKQKQWTEALTEARRVLGSDPDNASMHANCAYALLELGNIDEAIRETDRALYCNVRLPQSYRTRGRLRMVKGEHSAAVEDFTRAILLGSKIGEFYAYRASAYEKLGESSLAEADLKKARELGWKEESVTVS